MKRKTQKTAYLKKNSMQMKYILLILLFFSTNKVFSQFNEDINDFKKINLPQKIKKQKYPYAKSQVKTLQVVFSEVFLFYKNFMSSQDNGSCPFEITCSEYFIKSIQKKGILVGFLSGIDRYTRCNGHSNDRYKYNPKTNKLVDPVDY